MIGIRNLRHNRGTMHKSRISLREGTLRRILVHVLVSLVWLGAGAQSVQAGGQGYPGGPGGGRPGMGGQSGMGQPGADIPSTPAVDKPDKAATKAYKAGMKSLARAHEYEEVAAKAPNADKKADALEKVNDAYGKALDQFTEALSNKGDMVEAWSGAGYVHLRLGAYNEAIDDYNHTLALQQDLYEAIEHRAEAYVAVDRLDEAKAAYMSLFNHARPLADELMVSMQKWLESHRAAPNGMRAADIDAFAKWLQEQGGIAKQAASGAAPAPASP
jgi:hypothetical protein